MVRKDVIRVIKEHFIKNGARIITIFRSGAVEVSYAKPKEKYEFGKDENKTSTHITERHHYDVNSGKPVHFLVDGHPINVNLIAKPQKHASIMEQVVIQSNLYGYSKGLMRALNMLKENKTMLLLLIGSILVGFISLAMNWMILQKP